MKRLILGTYCTIWSQQNPTASFGKIVVGSNCVKFVPPSVEKAANELAETKITSPPLAPLGSAMVFPLMPKPLFAKNTMGGRPPSGACLGLELGTIWTPVLVAVGVPGTNGAVGTGGASELTSLSKLGGLGGNGAPLTE